MSQHITDKKQNEIRMGRIFFILGAMAAFVGVAAGAFGAHGLKGQISAEMLLVFEVGVRYQMYHAFALIATGWVQAQWPSAIVTYGGWFFVVGIFLFSGSLYLLSCTGLKWLGAVTPLGGFAFLAGWACLALAVWRS